jgi:hypothetical protein
MNKTMLPGIVTLFVALLATPLTTKAQKLKFQVVTTTGTAFSITGATFKVITKVTDYMPGLKSEVGTALVNNTDVGLGPKFSLGTGYYRQATTADFSGYIDAFGDTVSGDFHAKFVRQNFGLRILGHFGDRPKIDWYYGLRLSYSTWSLETNALNWQLEGKNYVIAQWGREANSSPGFDTYKLSFPGMPQLIFGFRYFPLPFTAMTFEVGLGTPYWFSTGASVAVGGGTWINWLKHLKEKKAGGGQKSE